MLFNVIPIQLSLLPSFLSKLLIVYWVMDLLVFSWYEMLALFSHGSLPRLLIPSPFLWLWETGINCVPFSLPLAMGDWHQLCPLLPSSGYGRLASTVSPSPFLWLWGTGINCVPFSLPLAMGDWHQLCPLLPSSGYGRLASTVSPSPFLWLWGTGINCVPVSLPLAMGDWHQLCPLLPSSGYGRLASTVSTTTVRGQLPWHPRYPADSFSRPGQCWQRCGWDDQTCHLAGWGKGWWMVPKTQRGIVNIIPCHEKQKSRPKQVNCTIADLSVKSKGLENRQQPNDTNTPLSQGNPPHHPIPKTHTHTTNTCTIGDGLIQWEADKSVCRREEMGFQF